MHSPRRGNQTRLKQAAQPYHTDGNLPIRKIQSASIDRKEHLLPLMQILLTLIAVGVLLWLVNHFVPMQGVHQKVGTEWRRGRGRGSLGLQSFRALPTPSADSE